MAFVSSIIVYPLGNDQQRWSVIGRWPLATTVATVTQTAHSWQDTR
jgi:hypothetical protein